MVLTLSYQVFYQEYFDRQQITDSYVIDPNGNKDCVCLNHYSTFWNCRPRSEWKYSYCKCDDQKTICQRTKHSLNLDIRNSQKRMQCICSEDICFGTDNGMVQNAFLINFYS